MCTKFTVLYSQLLLAIPLPVDSMLVSNLLVQSYLSVSYAFHVLE